MKSALLKRGIKELRTLSRKADGLELNITLALDYSEGTRKMFSFWSDRDSYSVISETPKEDMFSQIREARNLLGSYIDHIYIKSHSDIRLFGAIVQEFYELALLEQLEGQVPWWTQKVYTGQNRELFGVFAHNYISICLSLSILMGDQKMQASTGAKLSGLKSLLNKRYEEMTEPTFPELALLPDLMMRRLYRFLAKSGVKPFLFDHQAGRVDRNDLVAINEPDL